MQALDITPFDIEEFAPLLKGLLSLIPEQRRSGDFFPIQWLDGTRETVLFRIPQQWDVPSRSTTMVTIEPFKIYRFGANLGFLIGTTPENTDGDVFSCFYAIDEHMIGKVLHNQERSIKEFTTEISITDAALVMQNLSKDFDLNDQYPQFLADNSPRLLSYLINKFALNISKFNKKITPEIRRQTDAFFNYFFLKSNDADIIQVGIGVYVDLLAQKFNFTPSKSMKIIEKIFNSTSYFNDREKFLTRKVSLLRNCCSRIKWKDLDYEDAQESKVKLFLRIFREYPEVINDSKLIFCDHDFMQDASMDSLDVMQLILQNASNKTDLIKKHHKWILNKYFNNINSLDQGHFGLIATIIEAAAPVLEVPGLYIANILNARINREGKQEIGENDGGNLVAKAIKVKIENEVKINIGKIFVEIIENKNYNHSVLENIIILRNILFEFSSGDHSFYLKETLCKLGKICLNEDGWIDFSSPFFSLIYNISCLINPYDPLFLFLGEALEGELEDVLPGNFILVKYQNENQLIKLNEYFPLHFKYAGIGKPLPKTYELFHLSEVAKDHISKIMPEATEYFAVHKRIESQQSSQTPITTAYAFIKTLTTLLEISSRAKEKQGLGSEEDADFDTSQKFLALVKSYRANVAKEIQEKIEQIAGPNLAATLAIIEKSQTGSDRKGTEKVNTEYCTNNLSTSLRNTLKSGLHEITLGDNVDLGKVAPENLLALTRQYETIMQRLQNPRLEISRSELLSPLQNAMKERFIQGHCGKDDYKTLAIFYAKISILYHLREKNKSSTDKRIETVVGIEAAIIAGVKSGKTIDEIKTVIIEIRQRVQKDHKETGYLANFGIFPTKSRLVAAIDLTIKEADDFKLPEDYDSRPSNQRV